MPIRVHSRARRRLSGQKFLPFATPSFAGLNEDPNPNALSDNELGAALNCALAGALGTRPGLMRESAASGRYDARISASNNAVQGIWHWSRRNDFSRDKLLVIAGGRLYTDDTTMVAQAGGVTMTAGVANVWTFAAHQSIVLLAGGAAGDTFSYWDGTGSVTAITVQDLSAATLSPRYVLTKWGFCFIAGMNPGSPDATNNKMVVRFTDLGVDPTTTAAWPTWNTIGSAPRVNSLGGLAEYGDEWITGLAEYEDNAGDWLLILTSKRIAAMNRQAVGQFAITDSIPNGCVHQRAFVSLGVDAGDAVYLSSRGIHSLRQSQQFGEKADSFLSWKIRRTFATVNPARIHQACGAYDATEGYVLFAIATGSSTYNDTILCLDVKDQPQLTSESARWYVWRLGRSTNGSPLLEGAINAMTVCRDENGVLRLFVGTASTDGGDATKGGDVGYFQRSTYSDFGVGYGVKWRTKYRDFGAPSLHKVTGDYFLDVNGRGAYTPLVSTLADWGRVQLDQRQIPLPDAAGGQWGSGAWDVMLWGGESDFHVRRKFYGRGSGFAIAREFSHAGTNEPFFVAGMVEEVAPLGETPGSSE